MPYPGRAATALERVHQRSGRADLDTECQRAAADGRHRHAIKPAHGNDATEGQRRCSSVSSASPISASATGVDEQHIRQVVLQDRDRRPWVRRDTGQPGAHRQPE